MFYITLYIDEYSDEPRVSRQKRFTRSFMGYDEDGKVRAAVGEFISQFMHEKGGVEDGNVRDSDTGQELQDRR